VPDQDAAPATTCRSVSRIPAADPARHAGLRWVLGAPAPQVVYGPARADDAQRRASLAAWARRLETIDAEAPIEVGTY